MLDGIIFDYDGVIGDTKPRQYDWFKVWAKMNDKPFPYTFEQFEPLYNHWQAAVGPEKTYHNFGLPADMSHDQTEVWIEYRAYKAGNNVDTFPGMKKAMKEIWDASRIQVDSDSDRSIRLAINTTNDGKTIRPSLEKFGMLHYFDNIIATERLQAFTGRGNDVVAIKKPSKISVALALLSLGAKGSRTIHVGDTIGDLKASYDVFMYHPKDKEDLITVGCAWGYDGEAILRAGAEIEGRGRVHFDHIVNKPSELVNVVKPYL